MGLEALDAHRIANPVAVVLEVYSVGVGVGVKPHGVGAHDVDGVELAFLREDRAAGVAVVGAARDAVHGEGLTAFMLSRWTTISMRATWSQSSPSRFWWPSAIVGYFLSFFGASR